MRGGVSAGSLILSAAGGFSWLCAACEAALSAVFITDWLAPTVGPVCEVTGARTACGFAFRCLSVAVKSDLEAHTVLKARRLKLKV